MQAFNRGDLNCNLLILLYYLLTDGFTLLKLNLFNDNVNIKDHLQKSW